MKTIVALLLTMFFVFSAQAETIYHGVIDLTSASNGAKFPTEINAGKYFVEITLNAATADSATVSLNKSYYRDDNDMVCSITGKFVVGKLNIRLQSMVKDWETSTSSDIYAYIDETTKNESTCDLDIQKFVGTQAYRITPWVSAILLPIKDTRFDKVKLSITPVREGFVTSYSLKASQDNALQAINPGQPFSEALTAAGNKTIGYALSLEADNSYFHFQTEKTLATKVK